MSPQKLDPDETPARALGAGDELQPGDAYMDGPYLVFTAQYHLRRGSCCQSGCRHCPYRDPSASPASAE